MKKGKYHGLRVSKAQQHSTVQGMIRKGSWSSREGLLEPSVTFWTSEYVSIAMDSKPFEIHLWKSHLNGKRTIPQRSSLNSPLLKGAKYHR
jgi:hypothetical protein